MNERPINDRLIVRKIEPAEKVQSGIVIPVTTPQNWQEGEVVAIGNGRLLDDGTRAAMTVKVGDRIRFGRNAGVDITGDDGIKLAVMNEPDVLTIMERAEA